jgi:hypothetical protein
MSLSMKEKLTINVVNFFTFSRKVQNQCRHQWRQTNQMKSIFFTFREKFQINVGINGGKTKSQCNFAQKSQNCLKLKL